MRKLLTIFFVFLSSIGISQPVTNRSSNVITVKDERWMAGKNMFAPVYADTTSANLEVGIDSCGALIFTKDYNGFWYRACSPKRWIQILPGGSSTSDTLAWRIGGNSIVSITGPPYLGTKEYKEIIFITDNKERAVIPPNGIVFDESVVKRPLLFDTVTKVFSWGNPYATQQALEDTAANIRGDFPTYTGVTQQQLDDTSAAIRGAIPSQPTDTTGKFVNSVVSNTDSTITVCKAGTCIEYVLGSTIYVVNPLRYVDSSDGKRYLTIDTTGLGGGTPIDTANKWVTQTLRRADSVFYVKGGTQTFAYKDSVGSGSSSDSLDVVVQRGDRLLRDIRIFSPNGIDTVFVRDSTVHRINFASNTLNNTQKAKLLSRVQTEKYNTLDPAGKKQGHWSRYAISNNYNGGGSATHRQGLIFTEGYNINKGGSADLVGEGYFQTSLETDYGRKFEWYHQVGVDQPSRGHFDTRPVMLVANKDTLLSEWAFRTTFIHAGPIDTAMDYFNTQNGQLTIDNVQGRTSPSAGNTTLRFQLTGLNSTISFNGTSLIFGGASLFSFSNPVAPTLHNTYDLGAQSARWRKGFIQALQTSMTVAPDANYTQLISDETISFKNITASRQLTLVNTFTGNTFVTGTQLTVVTGQASFPVTFAGTTVKNIDGTTATSLPAGKSCVLKYDGTNWQVISVSSGTL